jgi:hypothetical protein
MSSKKYQVLEVGLDYFENLGGNASIPNVERLVEEIFLTDCYLKIKDEERIWHKSETLQLLQHIQQRKQEGGDK